MFTKFMNRMKQKQMITRGELAFIYASFTLVWLDRALS